VRLMGSPKAEVYIGLVHSPVYNKRGDEITTTLTNMDLHDIARVGRTYDVKKYYVINPLKSQQRLLGRMKKYWSSEYGAEYNSTRREAFDILEAVSSLQEAIDDIRDSSEDKPQLAATSARDYSDTVSFRQFREHISEAVGPFLIIYGTGWGLTREILEACDYLLEPLRGRGDYNHLSVRCAAAVILDRLLAEEWWK